MIDYISYGILVSKTIGWWSKTKLAIKLFKEYLSIYLKNPEVIFKINKTFTYVKDIEYNIEDLYDYLKEQKNLNITQPKFNSKDNSVSFLSENSKITFYLKIHDDIKHITLESQNYNFSPFRNSQRIKFLSEDFKNIHSELLTKLNNIKVKNEFINCEVKLEKIKNEGKIEFIFDGCVIISKNKNIQITKISNKNYENLIKAVICSRKCSDRRTKDIKKSKLKKVKTGRLCINCQSQIPSSRRSDAQTCSKSCINSHTTKTKYHENVKYRLMCLFRGRINEVMRRKGWNKSKKSIEILGCTKEQFAKHIESQFKEGMNWSNKGEWHIDHIIPLASAINKQEVYKLCHHTNLQPLWAKENLCKGAKII